jgi:hypothetical protein
MKILKKLILVSLSTMLITTNSHAALDWDAAKDFGSSVMDSIYEAAGKAKGPAKSATNSVWISACQHKKISASIAGVVVLYPIIKIIRLKREIAAKDRLIAKLSERNEYRRR